MRGLGAILESNVSHLAAVQCSALESVSELGPDLVQLLFYSFLGESPPGTNVSKATMDAFTLRAIQCDLYSRPASAEGAAWIRATLPLAACLDNVSIQIIEYQQQHGYSGPDAAMNAAAWLLSRDFGYHWEALHTPPCPSECLDAYRTNIMHDAIALGGAFAEAAPALAMWAYANAQSAFCPDVQAYAAAATNCASVDTGYCQSHPDFNGPDGEKNYTCWVLSTAGLCPPSGQTQQSSSTTLSAEHTTTVEDQSSSSSTPSAEHTTTVEDQSADYQQTAWDQTSTTNLTNGRAPPPPAEKSNLMLYGLIGLAVVGGGAAIYFGRKKR